MVFIPEADRRIFFSGRYRMIVDNHILPFPFYFIKLALIIVFDLIFLLFG